MTRLRALGVSVDVPPGWDVRIYSRADTTSGPETSHAVLHAATFALPAERGDYGSGAVEAMAPGDLFLALVEHDPGSAGTALFCPRGLPVPLEAGAFSPAVLQRKLPGQAGLQRFFNLSGRAWSLYAVVGSYAMRSSLASGATRFLEALQLESSRA